MEPGALVVLGVSVQEGDRVEVSLADGEAIGSAGYARSDGILPQMWIAKRAHSGLNATIEAPTDARVLLYVESSCACENKSAPFPGAILAFHGNVTKRGAVHAAIEGPPGARFDVRAYAPDDLERPAAEALSTAGRAPLAWTASATGLAYVVVTVLEGSGPFRVSIVGDAPEARMPFPAALAVALVLALAWVRAGAGRRPPG